MNGNSFYIFYENQDFKPEQLLLVRGIKNIGQSFYIQLTETGKILLLPEFPEYIELMNYMVFFKDN